MEQGMLAHACNPNTWEPEWENQKFKAPHLLFGDPSFDSPENNLCLKWMWEDELSLETYWDSDHFVNKLFVS